jgi:hypothetical protein
MDENEKRGVDKTSTPSLAPYVMPFQATVKLRRIEEEEAEEEVRRSILPSNELIAFGSTVLDNIMDFLDKESLMSCRQVCRSWEIAARRTLMKECGIKVEELFENERHNQVELYSSWIINYKSLPNEKLMALTSFLQEWGNRAKSLTVRGLILDAGCLVWIRRLLCVWCTNIEELNLEFEEWERSSDIPRVPIENFRTYLEDRDEVKFEIIWKATTEHPFAPYPDLPNLQYLRVSKMSNQMTSLFSINVMLSCPNLRQLIVSEQRQLCMEFQYGFPALDLKGGWRILAFLSTRPDITMKLDAFEWQDDDADGCTSSGSIFHEVNYWCIQQHINERILETPFLQFGDNLKTLRWNVLHFNADKVRPVFPRVLDQVAGNLRELDLRELRTNSGNRLPQGRKPLGDGCKGHFPPLGIISCPLPFMPKLSSVYIMTKDCYQLSLNELVDVAPNLLKLEISPCRCDHTHADKYRRSNNPWKVRSSEQSHNNLKCLKSGLTLWNTDLLQNTLRKFPNLQELWLGVEAEENYVIVPEKEMKLDDILHTLEQLNSLKRFHWTASGPVYINEVVAGLAEASVRMHSLQSCHIHVAKILCPIVVENVDAVESDQLQSSRVRILEKILLTEQSGCKFIVTTRSEDIFEIEEDRNFLPGDECPWKEQLLLYIKRHRLPIDFIYSSGKEKQIIKSSN